MTQELQLTNLRARLDDFVARVRAETRVPGIGIGVSVSGARFYAFAGRTSVGQSEPLTTDAQFQLGCVGKLLLAVATLELERRGVLSSSAVIGEYLPELRGSLHADAVRVAHLLSHTSGYRGTNVLEGLAASLSWPKLVAYLQSAERMFAPGDVFSYEHTEAVLLGEILQRAAGRPWDTLVAESVLEPLGIGALAGGGSARTPAGRHQLDLAANRFVALDAAAVTPPFWRAAFSETQVSLPDLLTVAEAVGGGETAGAAPFSDALRDKLRTAVVRLPPTVGGPLRELLPVGFGLGAAELRDGSNGSTGVSPGQCLGLRFDGRTGVCVAVGMNAMAPYLRDFVLTTVLRNVCGLADTVARDPFPFELAELEGTYAGPGRGTIDARCESGLLACTLGREDVADTLRVELARDDEGHAVLRSPLPHVSLGFFRAPDGEIGLMLGLSAYRRRSTERPFQR